MKRLLLILLITTLFVSCSDDEGKTETADSETLSRDYDEDQKILDEFTFIVEDYVKNPESSERKYIPSRYYQCGQQHNWGGGNGYIGYEIGSYGGITVMVTYSSLGGSSAETYTITLCNRVGSNCPSCAGWRLSDESRKEVTDESITKEVILEQEPCLADESYRTPRIKCFKFTDSSHNFTHSIVEYLGTEFSVFGWKDEKGWHFTVYYAFAGETC